MRLALTALPIAMLAGCGGDADKTGPERRNAAGEVLGGEVSDDMLPLDTVRSTSPAGVSAPADDTKSSEDGPSIGSRLPQETPKPGVTMAPMPDMTMPADPAPLPTQE